ncbi:hypothetical protein HYH02_005506 [Chlamydomonas schloesseri]|uniref:protein acetyllysine N-acetyltransferase n=1 Tax=Chlamydomonas schloesseri TaxID=2026947 RepID=A0A835WKZ6_9CHLO|nr:hypothetical protein HYH02_005506 [Chlamydomonas schloesseri]|eukprot:KAG2449351.1 hypothetical protein HYH02_005506 [Chlamydomonas schloesseri]
MSLGYADRLKPKKNLGGQLGAQEFHQDLEDIRKGVQELAGWVRDAKRVFVFTGAGISTACGIPDFRGPNGIWTLRKKGEPLPTNFTPFEYARPSFTHMAIAALVGAGKCPYVCSQNVDSLHLWSGVPRAALAELHGNCFAERCRGCGAEYARDFQMETVDFRPTGRRCSSPGCGGGVLVDNILDWDTPLPQDELDEAVKQAEEADVALVLGTSLQIQPANEIPVLTRDEGGKLVIVNLQKTPKDRRANLLLRARVDLAMALLMRELGMQVPPYIRTETLVVDHEVAAAAAAVSGPASGGAVYGLTVHVSSRHGRSCPLPIVESLEIVLQKEETDVQVKQEQGQQQQQQPGCGVKQEQQRQKEEDGQRRNGHGAAAGSGDGTEASGSGRGGAAWGPVSSGVLTVAPGACGGSSTGYSHCFSGLPAHVRRLRCSLRVRLVRYADADKREVLLSHTVDLGEALALAAPSSASSSTSGKAASKAAAGEQETGATVSVRHSFVSQRTDYDAGAVIDAFAANPPPVVLPEPPRKRQKKDPSPVPAPTRVSARRASRNSQRAGYSAADEAGAAGAEGSAGPSSGRSGELGEEAARTAAMVDGSGCGEELPSDSGDEGS